MCPRSVQLAIASVQHAVTHTEPRTLLDPPCQAAAEEEERRQFRSQEELIQALCKLPA